jgi:hypothetical protein
MVDYIGHSFTIEIVGTYDSQFFFSPLKTLCQKLHGHLNASSNLVQETMHNIDVVFRLGMFEDEIYFEQINVFFKNLNLKNIVHQFYFSVYTFQANLFGYHVCKYRFDMNCHVFAHLMCHWEM